MAIYRSSPTPQLILSQSMIERIKKHRDYIESYIDGDDIEYYSSSLGKYVLSGECQSFYVAADIRYPDDVPIIPVDWSMIVDDITCISCKDGMLYFWAGGYPVYDDDKDMYISPDDDDIIACRVLAKHWRHGRVRTDASAKDAIVIRPSKDKDKGKEKK